MNLQNSFARFGSSSFLTFLFLLEDRWVPIPMLREQTTRGLVAN